MIRLSKYSYGKAAGISLVFHGLLLGFLFGLSLVMQGISPEIIELAPVELVGGGNPSPAPAVVPNFQPKPKIAAEKPKPTVIQEPVTQPAAVINEALPQVVQSSAYVSVQSKPEPTGSGPVELSQINDSGSKGTGETGGAEVNENRSLGYTNPIAIYNPKPLYPAALRKTGWEGVVLLQLVVKNDGTVGSLTILEGSGNKLADENARQTVRKWRFYPATKEGKPIVSYHNVRIRFQLNNGKY